LASATFLMPSVLRTLIWQLHSENSAVTMRHSIGQRVQVPEERGNVTCGRDGAGPGWPLTTHAADSVNDRRLASALRAADGDDGNGHVGVDADQTISSDRVKKGESSPKTTQLVHQDMDALFAVRELRVVHTSHVDDGCWGEGTETEAASRRRVQRIR
jgi:hypothetical protein